MTRAELVAHIEQQMEESAQMGEPPSFSFENVTEAAQLLAILRRTAPEELVKSREIFRDAFAHISMHIDFNETDYGWYPKNEWYDHAAVQDAIAEERRLIGEALPQHGEQPISTKEKS